MGMPAATDTRYWTPDDVWALPDDGNRYECIDGVLLVSPSPRLTHQRVLGRLHLVVAPYVASQRMGEALLSPADIQLNAGNLVQPDLFVVPADGDGRSGRDWTDVHALLLAVEVLSPSTARYDRALKRRYYQRSGVGEYWVVDATSHLVERWCPDDERPEIITETLTWQPAGASEALVIDLVALFRESLEG
jgi:Uma2 family endonuclease